MSMMGNFGPSSADEEDGMREQRRKNISAVLQRLSDKQSSGYESEKEGDLAIQTQPRDRDQSTTDITETSVHTYSEYEEVQIRQSKMKQESWMKYQQEIVQQSTTSSSTTSHSVCYPIPKPIPSQSAYKTKSEEGHLGTTPQSLEKASTQSKESLIPVTWHGSVREPVIIPRQQSPFCRPHLWRGPVQGGTCKDPYRHQTLVAEGSQSERHVEEMNVPLEHSRRSTHSISKRDGSPRKVELFPPAECMSGPVDSRDPADTGEHVEGDVTKTEKKMALANPEASSHHPRSFKKYLQERYISSLKDHEDMELKETVDAVPFGSGHHSRDEEERLVDVGKKDPSFSSTDSEGRGDVILHSEVFIRVRDLEDADRRDEEEGKDDNVFESDYEPHLRGLSQPSQKVRLGSSEEPLDLTSKQQPLPTPYIGHEHSFEDVRGSGQFPSQLSPSMYHHSPPMFYSPQHEIISPRSPLWAVPEGRVFNFNLPSPFEPRCHSEPEFFSPGFSPDSPVMHFTFPPRSPFLGSGSEHSRLPKSPRLVYPASPSQFSASPGKTLPKLFCSPPPMSDFVRQPPEGTSSHGSELTYICPVCGQVFPSYDNLAKHMAKHLPTETVKTADNNKIHYCKVCNRAFSRSDMLTRHMRLHTGLKPYECRVCGQVFSRSDHLNTHQRTHTGEKPYRCPQCPYAACRRDMITRHMRIHLKRSSKRSKYLSVPEGESGEVRKSSVSSTDTTDSQEHSGRTCSVSSIDSADSEGGSKKTPLTSGDSGDLEAPPPSSRLWSSASAESTDFDEPTSQPRQSSSAFYLDSPGPFLEPTLNYRKSRNWSTTSFESIDSEGSGSRRDSVADDFGDCDPKFPTDSKTSRDTPIIDDSLRKFTISTDDIQN